MWRKFEARISVLPTLDTTNQFLAWLTEPIENQLKMGGHDGAGATNASCSLRTDPAGRVIMTLLVNWPSTPTEPKLTQVRGAIKVRIDSGAEITDCGYQPDPAAQPPAPETGSQASNGDQNKATGSTPPYPV